MVVERRDGDDTHTQLLHPPHRRCGPVRGVNIELVGRPSSQGEQGPDPNTSLFVILRRAIRNTGIGDLHVRATDPPDDAVGHRSSAFRKRGFNMTDASTSPDRKVVCVLGMHRSGTSAFTGILNLKGMDLGEPLEGKGENNPEGHWEYLPFGLLKTASWACWEAAGALPLVSPPAGIDQADCGPLVCGPG